MIWTAILVACLVSAPEECRTHEMIIHGNGIPTAAFIEAQFRAAEWLRDHPGMQQRSLVLRVGRGV
jgi:hypothetical protein